MKQEQTTSSREVHTSFLKRYYYKYLGDFLGLHVPHNAKTLHVSAHETMEKRSIALPASSYDYIVMSDVLGYVYDIVENLENAKNHLSDEGRIVITKHSSLWEPILHLASRLGIREQRAVEQNWLSLPDLRNMALLAGLETIKHGTKMIVPIYIPLISTLCNKYIANIWPFTHLGLFHYIVARKIRKEAYSQQPSLSIVVPARNEAGTIEKIVRELPHVGSHTEIIFIEGNSTDNTFEEIERVSKQYGSQRKILYGKQQGKGKADAVKKGFDMATGDILTIYDADMTVPAEEMVKFYKALVEDRADFINGSRLVYPMEKESMYVLNLVGNKFFSLAFSWILGQELKDTLCGTKMLRRSDYEKIKNGRAFFGDFDPFGDFDLLFGAAKLNLKIIDLPVHYKQRIYGQTNISRWKHGWLLLKMTVFAARKLKFL